MTISRHCWLMTCHIIIMTYHSDLSKHSFVNSRPAMMVSIYDLPWHFQSMTCNDCQSMTCHDIASLWPIITFSIHDLSIYGLSYCHAITCHDIVNLWPVNLWHVMTLSIYDMSWHCQSMTCQDIANLWHVMTLSIYDMSWHCQSMTCHDIVNCSVFLTSLNIMTSNSSFPYLPHIQSS